MSKMDGLRAMRAERFERLQAQPSKSAAAAARSAAAEGGTPATTGKASTRKPPTPVDEVPVAPSATEEQGDGATHGLSVERLCGHKAISGRTCTREHGHTAKSHRYS